MTEIVKRLVAHCWKEHEIRPLSAALRGLGPGRVTHLDEHVVHFVDNAGLCWRWVRGRCIQKDLSTKTKGSTTIVEPRLDNLGRSQTERTNATAPDSTAQAWVAQNGTGPGTIPEPAPRERMLKSSGSAQSGTAQATEGGK